MSEELDKIIKFIISVQYKYYYRETERRLERMLGASRTSWKRRQPRHQWKSILIN